tara:strand:- start:1395 stop:1721 length:327 start_codon:yes stop_codon:yes gene_type:complete
MKIPESTSYLTIEVISDQIEGNERVVHIRKICTGNPVEQFITDSVIRSPVEVKEETKPRRARNKKGHYVKDDPSTPENEAWVGGEAPKVAPKKTTRRRRSRKSTEVSK